MGVTQGLTQRWYWKPNEEPMYFHMMSNHLPRILENLPKTIGRQVSYLSCDQQTFSEAAPMYERALGASEFDAKLIYTEHNESTHGRRKHQRKRNIIWFNPLFSKRVTTNVGRHFFQLVSKHFPKKSKPSKIFNQNKVNYSCMPNVSAHCLAPTHRVTAAQKTAARLMDNAKWETSCTRQRWQTPTVEWSTSVSDKGSGPSNSFTRTILHLSDMIGMKTVQSYRSIYGNWSDGRKSTPSHCQLTLGHMRALINQKDVTSA